MTVVPLAMVAILLTACIPQDEPPPRGYPPPSYQTRADTWRAGAPDEEAPPPRRIRQRTPPRYAPRDDQRPYEPQGGYRPDQPPLPRADRRVTTLPAPLAAWQASPVQPSAQTVEPSTYVVRPGDTLSAIGDRTGAGSDAIARANRLPVPFVVRAGQRLTIPGGRYHRVAAGQTGIAISRAYGVDWSRIVAANDLREPYTLRAGMRVLIPGSTSRSTAAERAAAFTLDIDDIVTGSEPALAANQRPVRPTLSPGRMLAPSQAVAAPPRLTSGFDWPVHGRIVVRFGPGVRGERYNGVKIAVPLGTPVLAAADGVVAYAGSGIPQLGGVIIVRHGDGWATVYGHASKLLVQRGQAVRRGQTIAVSGDTGGAARPEVHFEMRKGRTPIDPQRQLPAI
ncbi:M23 family metallopeptidase [Sphingomonas sp. CARO-RG-8B-R24-01]|uniref:M23 family metallopeptidase n=1 Tax=Sphingomonas sp. CARO-RG-8B-R24-01 TaxID=2914831 RepID=UPI001F5ADA91|nr:M23 family metallopeptidase [Sphingomonas sp. CARO-RG-8B-R24-01]